MGTRVVGGIRQETDWTFDFRFSTCGGSSKKSNRCDPKASAPFLQRVQQREDNLFRLRTPGKFSLGRSMLAGLPVDGAKRSYSASDMADETMANLLRR